MTLVVTLSLDKQSVVVIINTVHVAVKIPIKVAPYVAVLCSLEELGQYCDFLAGHSVPQSLYVLDNSQY